MSATCMTVNPPPEWWEFLAVFGGVTACIIALALAVVWGINHV